MTESSPRSSAPWWAGFLTGAVTTLGVLGLCAAGLTYTCRRTVEQRLDQVMVSPDGKHQAVQYTSKGGPAGGGWCGHRVALIAGTDSANNLAEFDRGASYFFEASCSSSVHAAWRGSDELHVTYTMPDYGVTVHQEPKSADGVRLTYELTAK